MIALEELGFGPCHHMRVLLQNENLDEMNMWCNLGQGSDINIISQHIDFARCSPYLGLATLHDLRTVLDKYNSSLDYPSAIYYDKLYEAYPDAKFILVFLSGCFNMGGLVLNPSSFLQTTRDPAEWEVSIKATILPATETFKSVSDTTPFASARSRWFSEEMLSACHLCLPSGKETYS